MAVYWNKKMVQLFWYKIRCLFNYVACEFILIVLN